MNPNEAVILGPEDPEMGTLATGKFADLALIALPEFDAEDPHELLLDSAAKPVATFFRGRPA